MTSQNSPATAADASQFTDAEMRQLIFDYYAAVRSLDVEAWGAKFAEDVTMEDPVGTPPVNGREHARQRYSYAVLVFSEVNMIPHDVFTSPLTNEAVVRWSVALRSRETGLAPNRVYGISYFKFNDERLIESFRAFWNPADLATNSHL